VPRFGPPKTCLTSGWLGPFRPKGRRGEIDLTDEGQRRNEASSRLSRVAVEGSAGLGG